MADMIDMTTATTAPTYAGILKGAGVLRAEATSCDRCGSILLTTGALAALACWGWAGWSLVQSRQSVAFTAEPVAVAGVTLGGLAGFLMTWAMCGNFRRRAMKLRLTADLALAQRDIAINSHVPVSARRSDEQDVAIAPPVRLRPPTPVLPSPERVRRQTRAAA